MCAFIILEDIAKLSSVEVLAVHVPWSVLDACCPAAWPVCCAVKHLDYCLYDRGTMVSHYHFHLNFYYYGWIELLLLFACLKAILFTELSFFDWAVRLCL